MLIRISGTIVLLLAVTTLCLAQPSGGDNAAPARRPDQAPAQPAPTVPPSTPGVTPSPGVTPCGAVAYTADGAFGAAYGMQTCEEAQRLAIDECVKVSTDKKDCTEGVLTRQEHWFHIQFCQRDRNWTTHVTSRPTLGETNREAGEWAKKSKYGSEYCRLVPNGLFHSGGLHTKL
jgi:hypothetical protein